MKCLFCGEELRDGDAIAEVEFGEKIRNKKEGTEENVMHVSQLDEIHRSCYKDAKERFRNGGA
jgi:hypothetical protein